MGGLAQERGKGRLLLRIKIFARTAHFRSKPLIRSPNLSAATQETAQG
jgi:hypothetical protein